MWGLFGTQREKTRKNKRKKERHYLAELAIWTIIINWKQAEATCTCIDSVKRCDYPRPVPIVVVENGSEDGSLEIIRAIHPNIAVLPQACNLGFAKAANIGMRYAFDRGAEAVLLLNNDATIAPSLFTALKTFLAHHDAQGERPVGIVSAKVFAQDIPTQLWSVGGLYRGIRVVNLGAGEEDYGQYDTFPLDFVYGCAMLLRRAVFHDIGGFDERFFVYYEDIDLCIRARAAGYRVALASTAHVWHEGAGSTQQHPPMKVFYETKGRVQFFLKHLRGLWVILFLANEAHYQAWLSFQRLRAGAFRSMLAGWHGVIAGLMAKKSS